MKLEDFKKWLPLIIVALVALGGLLLIKNTLFQSRGSDTRATIQSAKATAILNKEFSFPIKDGKGEEITRLKYTIESAELRDEIIVQGKRLTPVKGKTNLVLQIKISNSYNKGIEVNTKDFVRLSVNKNTKEWLASNIHNDPVTVQAISTQPTRLGFFISDQDKNLVLQVGEINGRKKLLPLDLK